MAYAALVSLKQTINSLLNHSRIPLLPSTQQTLESACKQITSLQQVLEQLNDGTSSRSRSRRERVDALEGRIRYCTNKLEDVLEFHELNRLLNPEEADEETIRQEIVSIGRTATAVEQDCMEELSGGSDDEDDNDDRGAMNVWALDFGTEMVGHSGLFNTIRTKLLDRIRPRDLWFMAFLGEEGSGRAAAAHLLFEEARGVQVLRAWVRVGKKQEMRHVLMNIISQIHLTRSKRGKELLSQRGKEELSKHMYDRLENRRYLIVLDDVHDAEVVRYLRLWLPDQSNGSLVIITTGSTEVSNLTDIVHEYACRQAYFEDVIWLIMQHVLELGPESPVLEAVGKEIIGNCRGLLFTAVKAILFLLKSEKTVEEWSKIAADKQNPVFIVADEISEVSQIKREMQRYKMESVEPITDLFPNVEYLKTLIHPVRFFSDMQIISLYGMAGIGKTTFVNEMVKDMSVLSKFDHDVWITLGPKYETEMILIDILASIYPHVHKLHMKGDEKLVRDLCVQLSRKRWLIVLDDLCSEEPLLHLRDVFPKIMGTTLVTTRLAKVVEFGRDDSVYKMELLDKEESWRLLHQKVFPGGFSPPELEKVGRKIAEKCDGLPLLIHTVAHQLLQAEVSQEYWNHVALGKEKSVFKNAHHQISEALLPTYESLPLYLKPYFLYIGTFQERYEIKMPNLTNLLVSEGFLEPNVSQVKEEFVAECLSYLVDRSLVLVQHNLSVVQIKTCRLHSVYWHLSNGQALKNNFFHAMNSYEDCLMESMESQRRLCIRNSILLGIKDVKVSMASYTTAHSLLCVCPFQQYPVPLNFVHSLRLLRVMDALTIRLYEFPIEVVKLVHLRYLGLTCNGSLPSSISNLWKLQFLIVKRYMNIKSSRHSSDLPMEIWDMKELKHLQVMGGNLPDHKCGNGLLNLSTLLDVSAQSCRNEVLKWIPNLKRLGIRIELRPDDDRSFFRFHHLTDIRRLQGLESLKCAVVNPTITSKGVPPPKFIFPSGLKRLSLSGTGYSWEHMKTIGELENLEVLKLKHYAFQGRKWEIHYNTRRAPFKKLKFLLIEDTDLEYWNCKHDWQFTWNLECLYLKHCYKLRELPMSLKGTKHFKKIEIMDCSHFVSSWAEEMRERWADQVDIHKSWLAKRHQQ